MVYAVGSWFQLPTIFTLQFFLWRDMRRKIINMIIAISAFVIIICVSTIMSSKLQLNDENVVMQGIQDSFISAKDESLPSEPQTEIAENNITQTKATQTQKNFEYYRNLQVDFKGLQKLNPDVYAWITIPGTCVDYPILQSAEDNFYLRKDIYGVDGLYGSIYSNGSVNSTDFTDFNTILYGHNREDNVMFASLHRFDEKDFFEKTDRIFVYTPSETLEYRIYACVKHNDYYLPFLYDFSTNAGRMQYISMLQNLEESPVNHLREGMEVGVEDKLITLSTCMDVNVNRFLVVGVLIQVYKWD